MTPNEICLLVIGIALGMEAMVFLHMWWDRQDERRRAAARAATADHTDNPQH